MLDGRVGGKTHDHFPRRSGVVSRHPVARAESMLQIRLRRLAGYLRSLWGSIRRPMIRTTRTLRIRHSHGLNRSTAFTTSHAPHLFHSAATGTRFHGLSRRAGPWEHGRKPRPRASSDTDPKADLEVCVTRRDPRGVGWADYSSRR